MYIANSQLTKSGLGLPQGLSLETHNARGTQDKKMLAHKINMFLDEFAQRRKIFLLFSRDK